MDMSPIMLVHSLVGTALFCVGFIALVSKKGSRLHRVAGSFFTLFMLIMGFIVLLSVWLEPATISNLGILFVVFICYLAITAWATVRPLASLASDKIKYVAPIVALCVFLMGLKMGIGELDRQIIDPALPPVGAYFFFSALAFIAMLLDINHLRVGGVKGKHKLARHLWRMTCAMFFATSTLFTGPGSVVFPESIRGHFALVVPQSLVILIALYWIYKLFASKSSLPSR